VRSCAETGRCPQACSPEVTSKHRSESARRRTKTHPHGQSSLVTAWIPAAGSQVLKALSQRVQNAAAIASFHTRQSPKWTSMPRSARCQTWTRRTRLDRSFAAKARIQDAENLALKPRIPIVRSFLPKLKSLAGHSPKPKLKLRDSPRPAAKMPSRSERSFAETEPNRSWQSIGRTAPSQDRRSLALKERSRSGLDRRETERSPLARRLGATW